MTFLSYYAKCGNYQQTKYLEYFPVLPAGDYEIEIVKNMSVGGGLVGGDTEVN